jgi:adenosylcobinamide kinase / adenosylcobinamide-phosphate guanylyltransferase
MPHELILGGQKSGKSRCAERRAASWLGHGGEHTALLIATALDGDAEMHQRIARHRADRAERVPALATLEVPHELPQAIARHSTPERLVVVDCLTLWLTNLLMPMQGPALDETAAAGARQALCEALRAAPGPVLLVSNEIGLGVAPMTAEARRFVDELGVLHQAVAVLCGRVTLLVAGVECRIKGAPE